MTGEKAIHWQFLVWLSHTKSVREAEKTPKSRNTQGIQMQPLWLKIRFAASGASFVQNVAIVYSISSKAFSVQWMHNFIGPYQTMFACNLNLHMETWGNCGTQNCILLILVVYSVYFIMLRLCMALKGSTNSHGITKTEVVHSSGQEGSAAGLAYSKQGTQYKRQCERHTHRRNSWQHFWSASLWQSRG